MDKDVICTKVVVKMATAITRVNKHNSNMDNIGKRRIAIYICDICKRPHIGKTNNNLTKYTANKAKISMFSAISDKVIKTIELPTRSKHEIQMSMLFNKVDIALRKMNSNTTTTKLSRRYVNSVSNLLRHVYDEYGNNETFETFLERLEMLYGMTIKSMATDISNCVKGGVSMKDWVKMMKLTFFNINKKV